MLDMNVSTIARLEYEERVRNWELERSIPKPKRQQERSWLTGFGRMLVAAGDFIQARTAPVSGEHPTS